MKDIQALKAMGIYGVICGKSLYSGTLKLREAVAAAGEPQEKDLDRFFRKDRLIPAVIQEASTGQVLMLAYYGQNLPAPYHGDGNHVVLEPFPRGILEQGGDQRPLSESGLDYGRL